jgi:hypothetical protein
MKNIYELELHETTNLPFGICIMRVAGGWIYDCWDSEKDNFKKGIFIPYNNEFQMVEKVQ